jgi:SAM-dependent methyltransferase
MNNYDFCSQWLMDVEPGGGVNVLDYGCGSGKIVEKLQAKNVSCYGCDIFYEGGDYSKYVDPKFFGTVIRRIENGRIPFDDKSFDYIINNQVMEHVEDLACVLAEMHRVLKPGGMILSLFPDRSVWREGHCGIPFLHWFPKGTKSRIYYAAGFRALGFGYHKGEKNIRQWSEDFCCWLDKWTYYRSESEIYSIYRKYFTDLRSIEDYWLRQRFEDRKIYLVLLPVFLQKLFVRKLGGLVFTAKKRPD